MNLQHVNCIFSTTVIFLLSMLSQISGQNIGFQAKPAGFLIGGQLTYDIYEPYCSIYMNLKRYDRPRIVQPGKEVDIYTNLLRRLTIPKFILFQTSFYQLAALSSYLETDQKRIFNRFNTFYDLNLIRSIGSSYEEPYSFSLLLGNITFLGYGPNKNKDKKYLKQSGSALAGFLISTGNHQICDNIYLVDRWYQYEFMLVGNLKEKNVRQISWNFRFGVKQHNNNIFRNVILLSVERKHSIFNRTGFSLTKNSILKYKSYVPTSFSDNPPVFVYHNFSFGKKFPVKFFNRKMFLVFAGGFRWEWIFRYDRKLKQFESKPSGNFIWLVQPNIEF
jgi:hypothetical protein